MGSWLSGGGDTGVSVICISLCTPKELKTPLCGDLRRMFLGNEPMMRLQVNGQTPCRSHARCVSDPGQAAWGRQSRGSAQMSKVAAVESLLSDGLNRGFIFFTELICVFCRLYNKHVLLFY